MKRFWNFLIYGRVEAVTLVAQHPYVTNVEEELKKIEKEEQAQQDNSDYFATPNNPEEKVENEE